MVKYKDIGVTYIDSARPGRVTIRDTKAKTLGGIELLDMSVKEAADLSQRLVEAVRMQGFEFVARKRVER